MRAETSSRVFGLAALLVAAFQLALVLGAPWGSLTWGGRFPGALPLAMRAVAAVSMLLLLGFAWVVRARAGLFGPRAQQRSRAAIWAVAGYSALGFLANAATPSVWERRREGCGPSCVLSRTLVIIGTKRGHTLCHLLRYGGILFILVAVRRGARMGGSRRQA